MKATLFAISTLSVAALASARTINKARATDSAHQAFELDVTTANLGLKDYYSREDGYIAVSLDEPDVLQSAVVRSVKNDVTCTVKDIYGYQIRKFGGEYPATYEPSEYEGQHAYTIGCFFDGEDQEVFSYQTVPSSASKQARQADPPRNGFEMDVTYATAGVKDYYSREAGFISEAILPGDVVLSATVRSVNDDVVCTIKDVNGWQVRKFGGEHPDTIELSEYEAKVATTVGCYFEGEEQ